MSDDQDDFEPLDEESAIILTAAIDTHGFCGVLGGFSDILEALSDDATAESEDQEAADYLALKDLIDAATRKAEAIGV